MIDGSLDAEGVERVLAAAAWNSVSDRDSPLLIATLEPLRIVWANAAATAVFHTAMRVQLSHIVFGPAGASRGMAGRLARLSTGTPLHLERLLLSSGFRVRPVTLLCKAVDADGPGRAIVFQVGTADGPAGVREPSASAQSDTQDPAAIVAEPAAVSASLPDPTEYTDPVEVKTLVETEVSAALQPALERHGVEAVKDRFARLFGRSRVQRFVWKTDAEGTVTNVGPEMASCVGDTALRPDMNLVDRLQDLVPMAGEVASRAIARHSSWSGMSVPWPVSGSNAVVTVVFGGAPSGSHSGYRGFGVIHLDQVSKNSMIETEAAPDETGASVRTNVVGMGPSPAEDIRLVEDEIPSHPEGSPPEDETSADRPACRLPIAIDEAPEAVSANDSAIVHATTDDATADVSELTAATIEATKLTKSQWSLTSSQRFELGSSFVRGAAKVVHLASFKSGGGNAPAQPVIRQREASPTTPESSKGIEAPVTPPLWSETPESVAHAVEEQPESQLSSNERYNFDEIARTLAAAPPWADVASGDVTEISRKDTLDQVEDPPAIIISPMASTAATDGTPSSSAFMLLDHLPIGALVLQGERSVFVNRTILELLGFESLADLRDAGDIKHLFQGQLQGLPVDSMTSQSVMIRSRDGDPIAVDVLFKAIEWKGEAATLMSIRRGSDKEVGAQVEAVRLELQKAEATNRDLTEALDMAASGVGFLDMAGRILSINAGAERLFGYDQREVVGDPCGLLLAPDQLTTWSTFFNGFTASQSAGRTTAFRRFAGRKRNGDLVRLAASLKRVGAEKICIVWNDDSNCHVTESELDAARREAERASSLKSEFLAKVSHEIRTPLNAILGFTEIIVDERFGPIGNERYKDYLKDIHASGTHVMSLINDLLDLSRIEAGGLELKLVAINPNAIVGESVATLQSRAHRDRIIIRSSLAPRLPLIQVDERALRQIVLNLLSNAVKFNEPGGQVIVSTAVMETGAVAIRIRDTGLGMSDDEIETAMKPFRQLATPKANAGSGLGLPLTKALVEANKATMTIKSRPREGTLVEIVFNKAPVEAVSLPAE